MRAYRPRMLVALAVILLAIIGGAALYVQFYALDGPSPEQGRERAAELLAALESYRQNTGHYPARLEWLVPQYISAIPRPAWRYDYDYGSCGKGSAYTLIFRQGGDADNWCGYSSDVQQWGCADSHPHFYCDAIDSSPDLNCPHVPLGGFYEVWLNERIWTRLGCATAPAEAVTGTEAYLCCAHSLWLREKRLFVVVEDAGPRWTFVPDESGLSPDAPLMVEPVPRGEMCFPATGRHGWLANSPGWSETCNGSSRGGEMVFSGALQQFEGGWLLWNGDVAFVLFSDGTWTLF